MSTGNALPSNHTPTVTIGRLSLEFVELGEGKDGEFDATNPGDVEYLRLDAYLGYDAASGADDDADAEDASSCTLLPVATNDGVVARILQQLAAAMTPARIAYFGLDSLCQRASWVTPAWVDPGVFDREFLAQLRGHVAG